MCGMLVLLATFFPIYIWNTFWTYSKREWWPLCNPVSLALYLYISLCMPIYTHNHCLGSVSVFWWSSGHIIVVGPLEIMASSSFRARLWNSLMRPVVRLTAIFGHVLRARTTHAPGKTCAEIGGEGRGLVFISLSVWYYRVLKGIHVSLSYDGEYFSN